MSNQGLILPNNYHEDDIDLPERNLVILILLALFSDIKFGFFCVKYAIYIVKLSNILAIQVALNLTPVSHVVVRSFKLT